MADNDMSTPDLSPPLRTKRRPHADGEPKVNDTSPEPPRFPWLPLLGMIFFLGGTVYAAVAVRSGHERLLHLVVLGPGGMVLAAISAFGPRWGWNEAVIRRVTLMVFGAYLLLSCLVEVAFLP